MRKKSIFTALIMVLTAFTSIFAVKTLTNQVANNTVVKAAVGDVFTEDFSDINKVNQNWGAYFVEEMTMETQSTGIWTDANGAISRGFRWYVQDNALTRCSLDETDVRKVSMADHIAILTLKTKQFSNFKLTVEFKRDKGTFFWPVVAFRQIDLGKYFCDDGAAVFVQKEGLTTLWGYDIPGSPFTGNLMENYSLQDGNWTTMEVNVSGTNLTVKVNGVETLSRIMPKAFFRTGYVSLATVNNCSSFRNLRIEELAIEKVGELPEQAPLTELDNPNSLTNLSGDPLDIEELDELKWVYEDLSNDKKPTPTPTPTATPTVTPTLTPTVPPTSYATPTPIYNETIKHRYDDDAQKEYALGTVGGLLLTLGATFLIYEVVVLIKKFKKKKD